LCLSRSTCALVAIGASRNEQQRRHEGQDNRIFLHERLQYGFRRERIANLFMENLP
jgi:hypothetical protein